jgi:hypothetical protein
VAEWAQAKKPNRGYFSALTCFSIHHSRWLGLRQPSEQKTDQRTQMLCQQPQWLSEPTTTERSGDRAAPSTDLPSNTVAVWAQAVKANKGQSSASLDIPDTIVAGRYPANQQNPGLSSALTFRARHHSGWLNLRRTSEQMGEHCPHVSFRPPQWLAEPTPTKRRGQNSALNCRAHHRSGWHSLRRPREQKP